MAKQLVFFFLSVFILQCITSCSSNTSNQISQITPVSKKQRGVHVFGRLDSINIQPLIETNVEWITLVPFAGQKDVDSAELRFRSQDSTMRVRRDSSWSNTIKIIHDAGIKVFFKPHVWINEPSDDKWRSHVYPSNEDNWQTWKSTYNEYILWHAQLAEKNKVELFCIGAEFTELTKHKPEYWRSLIRDVRKVYSGKLTYAANWYKEYEHVSFWDDLDFIGIQAYFPLTKDENPSVEQLSKGWKKHLASIEAVHRKYNLPVLFTELGYKSVPEAGIKPWEWMDYEAEKILSLETQSNCYQAFFENVWNQDWFAGVHLWQWRCDSRNRRGHNDYDFTPKNKPAQAIIAKAYER